MHPRRLLPLRQDRALRDGVRHDLLAPKVVDRSEVGLAERALELGDVDAHLLPRTVRGEVATEHVPERLYDDSPVRAVSAVVGLVTDAAPQTHPRIARGRSHRRL